MLRQLTDSVFLRRIVGQTCLCLFGVHPPQRRIFTAKHLLQLFVGGCFIFGPDGLPGLIEFRWVEVSGLRFYFGVFMQRGFQLGRIFLLLLVQFLQVGFQRGDVFSEGLGPGVLGILMRWPAVSCPG